MWNNNNDFVNDSDDRFEIRQNRGLTIFYNYLKFRLISIYKNKTKSIAVSTDT